MKEICREREKHETTEELLQSAGCLSDWETVKERIYPILLSTKENEEMLEELAAVPMLDLSVAYVIRIGVTDCASFTSTTMLSKTSFSDKSLAHTKIVS